MPVEFADYVDKFTRYLHSRNSNVAVTTTSGTKNSSSPRLDAYIGCYSTQSSGNEDEGEDVRQHEQARSPSRSSSHNSESSQYSVDRRHRKHSGKRRLVDNTVNSFFDRFASLNVEQPDIARLHFLYAQLMTRHEDWQLGKLSTRYFTCKLNELESGLDKLSSIGLPPNWLCKWDSQQQRRFYQHQVTGRINYDVPVGDESEEDTLDDNDDADKSTSSHQQHQQPDPDSPPDLKSPSTSNPTSPNNDIIPAQQTSSESDNSDAAASDSTGGSESDQSEEGIIIPNSNNNRPHNSSHSSPRSDDSSVQEEQKDANDYSPPPVKSRRLSPADIEAEGEDGQG